MTLRLALLASLFAAAPALAEESAADAGEKPFSVVGKPFDVLNVTEAEATYFFTHLADRMNREGVRVITPGEVSALIGLERQRQLLGCSESERSECLAELGGALGAPGMLTGSLGRFGETYQLSLKVLATDRPKILAAVNAEVYGDQALMRKLTEAARDLSDTLLGRANRPPPPEPVVEVKAPSFGRRFYGVPLGVSAVAAASAGALSYLSYSDLKTLERADGATLSPSAAAEVRDAGQRKQTLALACAGVAVAAAAAGVWMFATGSAGTEGTEGTGGTTLGVALAPGGASLSLSGTWP